MPVFKISDITARLKEIQSDGFEYVDLTIFDGDDDEPATLEFESCAADGNNSFTGVSYDPVESIDLMSHL